MLFDYSAPYELTLPPSLERLVSEERLKNQISFWEFATFKGASIEAASLAVSVWPSLSDIA